MEFEKNISLRKLNTFGINVKCKLYCKVRSEKEIISVINSEEYKNNPHLILSGGSNVVFLKDYEGLIIQNKIKVKEIIEEKSESTILRIGAGENWHKFVLWSINNGLSGLENMALIPGNVGSSPIQNIGAYGAEVKNVIKILTAIIDKITFIEKLTSFLTPESNPLKISEISFRKI